MKATTTEVLLRCAREFLREEFSIDAFALAFDAERTASPMRDTLRLKPETLLDKMVFEKDNGDLREITITFTRLVLVDWQALEELGPCDPLEALCTPTSSFYRISLRSERVGFLLLELNATNRVKRAVFQRFPRGATEGSFFDEASILWLLRAFQEENFSQLDAFRFLGAPQEEDDNGAQLIPFLGANLKNAFFNKSKDDTTLPSRIDLSFVHPIEVSWATFEKDTVSTGGPLEHLLSAPVPIYTYQFSYLTVELLLTVEGQWSQTIQRVSSLVLRRAVARTTPKLSPKLIQRAGILAPKGKAPITMPEIQPNPVPAPASMRAPAPVPAPSAIRAPTPSPAPAIKTPNPASAAPLRIERPSTPTPPEASAPTRRRPPTENQEAPRGKAAATEEFSERDLEETTEASQGTTPVLVLPPRLVLVYKEKMYSLDKEEFIIGRGKQSDLLIPDPDLSRTHAIVKKQGDRFTIEDHSINGIHHQGIKIRKKEIKAGDTFKLCDHEIRFVLERPARG